MNYYVIKCTVPYERLPDAAYRWIEEHVVYSVKVNLQREGFASVSSDYISSRDVQRIADGLVDGLVIEGIPPKRQDVFLYLDSPDPGKKLYIKRIKELRFMSGMGLREAKITVDEMMEDFLNTEVELTHPMASFFSDGDKKRLEDVGFRVIVKPHDIMPDNLFEI